MFARTETNEIYSWGMNNKGQLERGMISDGFLKPGKIDFFSNKCIINIVSHSHSLALSSDGKVYGWGSNKKEQVELGHMNHCEDLTENLDLTGVKIEEFLQGFNFARSESNVILPLSKNDNLDKLVREFITDKNERFQPDKNKFLSLHTSCSQFALSSAFGKVYGLESNKKGRVDIVENREEYVLVPELIDFETPIKFIACSRNHSIAVDINGKAFFWGKTSNGIQWKPMKMNVKDVKKIQNISEKNECFVLNESGKVFLYSLNDNKIVFEITVDMRIDNIFDDICETE